MRRSLEIPLVNSNPIQIQGITIQGNGTREPRMDFSWFGLILLYLFLVLVHVAFVDSSQHQFSLLITSTWFNFLKPSVKSGMRWQSCSSPAQTL